jgi:hypothetical protein
MATKEKSISFPKDNVYTDPKIGVVSRLEQECIELDEEYRRHLRDDKS